MEIQPPPPKISKKVNPRKTYQFKVFQTPPHPPPPTTLPPNIREVHTLATQYLSVFKFTLMILLPPDTSPLERGYSFLRMVWAKQGNELDTPNY